MEEEKYWIVFVAIVGVTICFCTWKIVEGNKYFVEQGLQKCPSVGSTYTHWKRVCDY